MPEPNQSPGSASDRERAVRGGVPPPAPGEYAVSHVRGGWGCPLCAFTLASADAVGFRRHFVTTHRDRVPCTLRFSFDVASASRVTRGGAILA